MDRDFMEEVLMENADKIESGADLAAACVHSVLLHKGYNVDESQANSSSGKNKMPHSWRANEDTYVLHYKLKGKKYILKGLKVESNICFYLYKPSVDEMREIVVDTEEHFFETADLKKSISAGNFDRIFKDIGKLIETLEILGHSSNSSKSSPRATHVNQRTNPLRDTPGSHQRLSSNPLLVSETPSRYNSFAYGQADLFPGGVCSGGMIFDPMRSQGGFLGPGPSYPGIMPGARFDPVFPVPHPGFGPAPRRPRNPWEPDPDHLRRPGFEDDMFM